MSVTVVNEWYFKKDGNMEEGMAAAAEYLDALKRNPKLQLSLWLRDRDQPRHFFHILVLEDADGVEAERRSPGTARFIDRLFPEIMRNETFKAPLCDVWLTTDGGRVKAMNQT